MLILKPFTSYFFTKCVLRTLIVLSCLIKEIFVAENSIENLNVLKGQNSNMNVAPIGYHLSASAFEYPPTLYIIKHDNGTFSYNGLVVEIYDYITRALNITYSFRHLNLTEVNMIGPVQAGIRSLIRKEVDVIGLGIPMGTARLSQMDLSFPVFIQQFNFVLPWPEEKDSLLAFIRPFQFSVWLWLWASLLFVTLVLCFLSKTEYLYSEDIFSIFKLGNFGNLAIYVLSILTSQGTVITQKHLPFRLVAGVWCLVTVILANSYAGTLIAYLTVPQFSSIVYTFKELAASKQYKLLAEANSVMVNSFMEAKEGYRKILGDSLRNDPGALITNPNNRLKQLRSGPYVYPVISPFFTHHLVDEAYKYAGRQCTHTTTNVPLDLFVPIVFPFRKNFPLMKSIDKWFLASFESGLTRYWPKKYRPRIDQCLLENRDKFGYRNKKSIPLIKLSGVFIVLGVGILMAFSVFLLEIMFSSGFYRFFFFKMMYSE